MITEDLLASWRIALSAEHKSAATVRAYRTGVRIFAEWCEDNGHEPTLNKALVQEWTADLLACGNEPATARIRQLAVRRFSAWCVDEGILDDDPLLGLKLPRLHEKVTPSLTDDELRRLIQACGGRDFRDRRDEAIVRLMSETGLRAGEVIALTVDDVDPLKGVAIVRKAKGGKSRIVPFGPQTARAIDRYMRERRTHRLASTDRALWLGDRGTSLAYFGLRKALVDRARAAEIVGFHLHLLRHSAASRWLAAGGSEGGLMQTMGWSSREMLDRYTRATASDRALAEARTLNLGDL
jgi:site-specific recombinase XerD